MSLGPNRLSQRSRVLRPAIKCLPNRGRAIVSRSHADLLSEVQAVVKCVRASEHKTKNRAEKTMRGQMLFNPRSLSRAFKDAFAQRGGWETVRVKCDYSAPHQVDGDTTRVRNLGTFREMHFIKRKLGIEIQFGMYASMICSACAKMTIFNKLGHIDCGVEIVPVKAFAQEMSTGVSYFKQFVWDLDQRGVSNIDIPVLILGIDA